MPGGNAKTTKKSLNVTLTKNNLVKLELLYSNFISTTYSTMEVKALKGKESQKNAAAPY